MNTAAETKNILYKVRERIPDKIRESKPKLLEQVRITLRTLHYSRKTEEAYIKWIKELILFNNKTHPKDLSKEHIEKFLSHFYGSGLRLGKTTMIYTHVANLGAGVKSPLDG